MKADPSPRRLLYTAIGIGLGIGVAIGIRIELLGSPIATATPTGPEPAEPWNE